MDGGGDAAFEFGCLRVLLRQRRLLVAGVPLELGARAFDLLKALLEADGAPVTRDQLLDRVWPGVEVSEENLKVQVSAFRKALDTDRNLIRMEFERGYRLVGILLSNATAHAGDVRPWATQISNLPEIFPESGWETLFPATGLGRELAGKSIMLKSAHTKMAHLGL